MKSLFVGVSPLRCSHRWVTYLGLFKALRDYKSERGVSFKSFATICIKRQITTALKQSTHMKHLALIQAYSLEKPMFTNDNKVLRDIVPAPSSYQPEELEINALHIEGKTLEDKLKLNLSIGLFVSKDISLGKAAQLAGKSLSEFINILNHLNIPAVEYTEEMYEDDLKFMSNHESERPSV